MLNTLREIYSKFNIYEQVLNYGNGHINDTYLCEATSSLILQRINVDVFNNPEELMENITRVTDHISKKILEKGGNPLRETLVLIKTYDGKPYYKADEQNCYRMYRFVENTVTIEKPEEPEQMFEAGRAFGRFQRMLDDFDASKLHETIIDFHVTPKRVIQLKTAIDNDVAGRKNSVVGEIENALHYSKYADMIVNGLNNGEIPLRVTHNDTKLNNVLFDANTKEGLCVIDLDTVMPGSMLYDFGDALRFGASTADEDETDLSKVKFDLEMFEAFSKGFLQQTADCLTEKEIELLPVSALILTYECGIRFLADYLNGDTYFKIHRENHNLDRARTQFKLVMDIENKLDQMKCIVSKYI